MMIKRREFSRASNTMEHSRKIKDSRKTSFETYCYSLQYPGASQVAPVVKNLSASTGGMRRGFNP